jgi:hypothetical protein
MYAHVRTTEIVQWTTVELVASPGHPIRSPYAIEYGLHSIPGRRYMACISPLRPEQVLERHPAICAPQQRFKLLLNQATLQLGKIVKN